MVANYSRIVRERGTFPIWFESKKRTLLMLTSEQPKEKIAWQNLMQQSTGIIKQFKGLVTEINDGIVTVVFKNFETNDDVACRFSIGQFGFEIKTNDFVLLNQCGMSFGFEKYNETLLEIIEDKELAKQISTYEEDYDI